MNICMAAGLWLAAHGAAAPAPGAAPAISGVVAETMDSGGYTYVRLTRDKDSLWLAVPQMKVKVGKTMAFEPGMEMRDFKSKTLNRAFPLIIFSGGPVAALPTGKGHGGMAAAHGSIATPAEKAARVAKSDEPDGVAIADLYARRKALDGKTASVRGKVIKVSAKIMGRNWLHLQDGTGDPKTGTHDLTVTTQALPDVGLVVVVKGRVRADQDFGGGYAYKVLVEDAAVIK